MSEATFEEQGWECDIFHLLSNERRRLTLRVLHETGIRNQSELATRIASLENDIPECELTSRQRKRVYIGLIQGHLPKLHAGGLIEYDKERGMVAPREWTRGLLPLVEDLQRLDETREYEPPRESPGIGLPGGYRVAVIREEGDA